MHRPREAIGQGRPVDELHHEVQVAVSLTGVEGGHGVGVGETGRRTRFPSEALPADGIDAVGRQELDRDAAIEAGVVALDDPRHAAGAERLAEGVTPDDHLLHGAGR